ncbi:hypothetical protein ACXWRS_09940, partial [Streptococcus pyogenes]
LFNFMVNLEYYCPILASPCPFFPPLSPLPPPPLFPLLPLSLSFSPLFFSSPPFPFLSLSSSPPFPFSPFPFPSSSPFPLSSLSPSLPSFPPSFS